ncbi:hypothetical protein [uncultured Clostridium sp.]|nr:hypothetical protein [uncultured Clostridium sp.]
MFNILKLIKQCNADIKKEQEKTIKKQIEFKEKYSYLGSKNLNPGKNLP